MNTTFYKQKLIRDLNLIDMEIFYLINKFKTIKIQYYLNYWFNLPSENNWNYLNFLFRNLMLDIKMLYLNYKNFRLNLIFKKLLIIYNRLNNLYYFIPKQLKSVNKINNLKLFKPVNKNLYKIINSN